MVLGLSVFCSLLNLFAVAVLLCSSGSTGYGNISPTPAVSDSEGPIGVFPIGNPSNAHTPAPQPSVLLPLPASPPISSAPVPQSIKGLAPSQSPVSKSYVIPPSSAHESTPSLAPSAPRRGRLKPEIPVSVVSPSSKPPQKAPKISAKHGSTPQDSERNKLPPVKPPISSTIALAPKETIHNSPPTRQPVAPGVQPFVFPAPVAPPPGQMLQNPLTNHPTIPEEPPSVLPAPPPSMNRSKTDIPIPAPPNEIPGQYPPLNSSPKEAPSANNTLRHASNVPPPLASPKSSPSIRSQSPLSSLPTSVYKHYHGKENVPSPAPLPFSHSPPASGKQGPIVSVTPSYSPKSHPKSGHKHDGSPYVDTDFPPAPPFPSQISPLSHHHSASSPPPSAQITFPSLSPNNSPASPTSKPKEQVLPRIRSLPPPPLNQDCQDLTCAEPLTNTPPGSPCGCVWPMQVELRLSVALYSFFPLVAKFAEEIAAGVFMKQSQIRIMGANAASQDSEKTTVLLDLVPLGDKFDNTTAYLTFQRFWQKLVPINASLFGSYEVLYVHYPGLPPSPPSSINVVAGQPFSDHGNNGRTIQPLGVDVRKGKHKKGLSGGIIAIAVLSASATILLCGAVAWVLLVKRGDDQPELSTTATVPSLSKPSGVAASIFGGGPSSASLSFGSSMATYTGSAKTFSSSDIQRATDSFNASRIIGEGGFGRVYSGVLEDGTEVAVKVLKRDDQHGSREFLAEVEMLSRLHHRNLVKLIGICTEERSRCLVYELISNGSLESHLYGKGIEKTTSLDWSTRLKIALGAARGLAYLHEDSSPRVIHRDFKSSNILLEHDFTPKVSDFGLARTALDEENRHVSTRVMGTFGYVAPEYAMTGHLLVKSDVYSYGVVLLELLTGRKPVDMSQPPGEENLVAWARPLLTSKEALESIIDSSLGPDFPFDSIAKVAAIASMCVQPEVSHRPFMGEVVQALKLVVSDESDEMKEFGSRCCSQEDLSIEMNDGNGANTSLDQMRYHMQNHSPLSDYDAERGLSVSDFFVSARVGRADSGSFKMYSSSGPLRSGKGKQLWQKMRRLSH